MPAEETALLTSAELTIAIERFEHALGTMTAARKMIDEGTGRLAKGMWTFRKPSLRFSLDRLESFERELIKAMEAQSLGIPYDANTPKNRKEREEALATQRSRVSRSKSRSRR